MLSRKYSYLHAQLPTTYQITTLYPLHSLSTRIILVRVWAYCSEIIVTQIPSTRYTHSHKKAKGDLQVNKIYTFKIYSNKLSWLIPAINSKRNKAFGISASV